MENRVERKLGSRSKEPSLLAGLLYDETEDRMTPSHANKHGRRYRYYVSRSLINKTREAAPAALRVAAEEIERAVGGRLTTFLTNRAGLHEAFGPSMTEGREQQKLMAEALTLAEKWPTLSVPERREVLMATRSRVTVGRESLELRLHGERLRSLLIGESVAETRGAATAAPTVPISLSAAFEVGRAGPDAKVLIEGGNASNRPGRDPNLVALLAQAHRYNAVFVRSGKSIAEMAREMGVTRSYFTRVLRLSFLAPAIIRAIMLGRQPATISASTLLADTRLPMLWKDQMTSLGFA